MHRDQEIAQCQIGKTRHLTDRLPDNVEDSARISGPADSSSAARMPAIMAGPELAGFRWLSSDLAFSVMPPATPTPSTYIHPSWKSNRCELNSEVKKFCTTTSKPIQATRPSPRNSSR